LSLRSEAPVSKFAFSQAGQLVPLRLGSLPPLPPPAGLRVLVLDNNTLSGVIPSDYAATAVGLYSFKAVDPWLESAWFQPLSLPLDPS
jgi:hypothetical protein